MMYFRYILGVTIVLTGKLAVLALAPLLAVCIRYYPESRYPVATRFGISRPHLWPWLRWAQSFDDALDSYWWWESRSAWLRKHFDQEYYDKHGWLRWLCRVLWLWRNSAYGLAYSLGFDQAGIEYTKDDDPEDQLWERRVPCRLLRMFRNSRGQEGFLYRARYGLVAGYYYEVVVGYKVPWPGWRKAMLASRLLKVGRS